MPPTHTSRTARAAVALVATAALTSSLAAAYAAPGATADDRPTGPTTSSRAEQRAVSAVDRARAVVDGRSRGDLTMALRDVANTRSALSGAQRAAADRLLARPGDDAGDDTIDWGDATVAAPLCSVSTCVHYVTTGEHAPSLTDADGNGRPDYVEEVLDTIDQSRQTFLEAGYRAPKTDGTQGGDARFDAYLGEIGEQGFYGYCAPDEPDTDDNQDSYDRWSFCGLDNDYAEFDSTGNTPTESMQVTVAHEFFHAVQFGYDVQEDSWLYEATAAWVEDEVYPDIDDNLQYLSTSQMTLPRVPLDTWSDQGTTTNFQYGTWSFFRFLTEKFPERFGTMPRLVLDIWRNADGKADPENPPLDDYSWKAVDRALRARGTSGAKALGLYAVANRRPARAYAEGGALRYPTAPVIKNASITSRTGATVSTTLNHLTTATARFAPKSLGTGYKLQLKLDLGDAARGSSVLVTSVSRNGTPTTTTVPLNSAGNAVKKLAFASSSVAWVEVTLVNGSGRFTCFNDGAYSCAGTSKDDRQPAKITASAVR